MTECRGRVEGAGEAEAEAEAEPPVQGPPPRHPRRDGRYLVYATRSPGYASGLTDRRASLAALLAEAEALGRAVVLPPAALAGLHNTATTDAGPVEAPWSKYVDVEALAHMLGVEVVEAHELVLGDGLAGLPWEQRLAAAVKGLGGTVTVVHDDVPVDALRRELGHENLVVRLWPDSHWHRAFPDTLARAAELHAVGMTTSLASANPAFRPSRLVASLAKPVLDTLGGQFAAAHVRRGDKLRGHPPLAAWASVTSLADALRPARERGIDALYIAYQAAAEQEPLEFAPLAEEGWRIFVAADFPWLTEVVEEDEDNYLLFAVEMAVVDSAAFAVRTFTDSAPWFHGTAERESRALVPWSMHGDTVDFTQIADRPVVPG